MKVLISGGIKTNNIVNGISGRFTSGGVDFIVINYITDIAEMYQRGEYFDKAIIIEQSWTLDYEEEDDQSVRSKVNNFAKDSAMRAAKSTSYVFLTQSYDTASKVYEEILPIHNESVVLVKEPRYSVPFFVDLVKTDVDKFPAELVYKPEVVEEVVYEANSDESIKDVEYETNYDDITAELFGDEEEFNGGNLGLVGANTEGFEGRGVAEVAAEPGESEEEHVEGLEEFEADFNEPEEFDEAERFESGELGVDVAVNTGETLATGFDRLEELEEEPVSTIEVAETYSEPVEHVQYQSGELPEFSGEAENEVYQDIKGGFDNSDYDDEPEIIVAKSRRYSGANLSDEQLRVTFDAFANRGNSILVTGCGGCGTSTIALNLANTINNLGYTVLLVDLDTENKAQSYISKDNYECVEPDGASLMAAINSTSGINAHVSIVRPGFHLLTMGMSSDAAPIDTIIHKDKIGRFINLAKTSHNFVIYDVPFKTAVGFGSDFTFMADNIVLTVDCSNWGITKTMLNMCNIEDSDMQETIFNRGQILFNKVNTIHKVMGKKVKTALDMTKAMDVKVRELLGEEPGYYFQTMHICGMLGNDGSFESGWFEKEQYSDTKEGCLIFIELLKNIILKR